MTVEVLFPEVCNLFGDSKNEEYLRATVPDAEFVETDLLSEPYFVRHTPDLILLGAMTEHTQRRVIGALQPCRARFLQLIEAGTVILATGNAGEVFMKHISYVTEKLEADGLGILDLTVKTDLFNRYNGKVLGTFEDITMVGFRSQFSFWYGDNSKNAFIRVERGCGLNPDSRLEGVRLHNFFCTSLLGPILPDNPLFCEYLLSLCGVRAEAAYKDAAMTAYTRRLEEFRDPTTKHF